MGGFARRAKRTDDDDFLALHVFKERDGIVIRRAVVAPVGQHEGIKLINHFPVDIADIIWPHVVGNHLRRRLRQAEGIAGDGRKHDCDGGHRSISLSG